MEAMAMSGQGLPGAGSSQGHLVQLVHKFLPDKVCNWPLRLAVDI